MWKYFRILQEFKDFETLEDMHVERKRGVQNRSVERQIPVTLYVK
jgi:hypothetical protein